MRSTKYNGAFVSLGLVAAHLLRNAGTARIPRLVGVLLDGKLWMATVLAVLALIAGTPYLILASSQYLALVSYQTSSLTFSMSQTDSWFWIPHAYVAEEHVLGVLMLGGLVLAAVRRQPIDWIVLAGWLPSFLYIGTWTRESLHYLLQSHPVLALMASRLVLEAGGIGPSGGSPVGRRERCLRAAAIIVVVSVLMINGVRVTEAAKVLTLPDTRLLAGQWIEANVPAGSKVAMTWLPYCPRLDLISSRESIQRYLGNRAEVRRAMEQHWQSRPAYRFVNLEAWLKQPVVPQSYREHVDLSDPETRRVFSRGWRSVPRLKKDGVQWVVLPAAVYERYMGAVEPAANTAAHYRYVANRAYFEQLVAPDGGLKLIAQFPVDDSRGHADETTGPSRGGRIGIYRVL